MTRWPLLLLLLCGCGGGDGNGAAPPSGLRFGSDETLSGLRTAHPTELLREESGDRPVPEPPPERFRLVRYPSPAGPLAAYLGPDPGDGRPGPGMVWLPGGFDNGIGEASWTGAPARAFREAGLVLLLPSLRGGNDNPGFREGFFGEVDDAIAAADFLAGQPHVDPERVYLGGHSAGATLALLAAAASDRFRAVFALGPVDKVTAYGEEALPFDTTSPLERSLRAPLRWLKDIRPPTFVFEGDGKPSNLWSLRALKAANPNPRVRFFEVAGADHFSLVPPLTRRIAEAVASDEGPECSIGFDAAGLDALFTAPPAPASL